LVVGLILDGAIGGKLHEVPVTQQVAAEVSEVAAQVQHTAAGMDHLM
jgi:hypothetical protein